MSDGTALRLGALCWNQYAPWSALLEAGRRADRLGYDSLWTWDHLYPIVGDQNGPILEGWMTLAAWAQATERIRMGLMVAANTFREPTLVAKMATTLGRAQLWTNQPVGTPDEVAEAIRPYLGIGPGYRHLLAGFPAPYDEESMARFATEVRPRLRDP